MADLDRRSVLAGLGGIAGTFALPGGGGISAALAQDKIYRWGSSSLGSTGYQIIAVLAQAATKHSNQRHSSLATAGGTENMALLREKQIEFGQTTSTDWEPALAGTGRFKDNPVPAAQMFAYTIWQCTPMVRDDSPIKTLADLKGRRVMPATAGGATNGLFQALFKAAGVEGINFTFGSWKETYDALAAGAVDCIPTLLTAGDPSGTLRQLTTTHKVRMLPIAPEIIAKARSINPGVMSFRVTPEMFPALAEPTLMLSFGGIAATRADMPEELVYDLTKAIFDNAEDVRKTGGVALKNIEPKFAIEYLNDRFPVHAGAARYFKEKGVWRNELKIAG
jgi:TRAP transporter TAXI family solute receptor